MRILINQCRPALAGGLFAAILLSFSDSANADTVTISKTGMPVPGGDSVDRFGPGLSFTPLPLLNDLGEVAFLAGLTGNSDSNRAILRGTGGLSPDGVNAYTLLGYTNGNDIALYTTGAALPNPTIDYQAGGPAVDLTFHGAAGQPYLLQRKADLNLPNWTTLQTLNAAPDGKVTYTDLSPPPFSAFYRITPP